MFSDSRIYTKGQKGHGAEMLDSKGSKNRTTISWDEGLLLNIVLETHIAPESDPEPQVGSSY